jgi:hypothetical protein
MANVYKNIQAKITPAGSDHDMYESPSATTSIVKSVKLFNSHSGALDVEIKVRDESDSTILEAGDKIKMQCATGNVIKMTASVLQISRPTEVTTT